MNSRKNASEGEKLQKLIASTGIASRREAERLIEAGQVRVNGRVAQLGERASRQDRIEVRGRPLKLGTQQAQRTLVLLYHKPEGRVCSRKDEQGRPTIFEQLPPCPQGRWISVGRLDLNTSGLLLLTNNGELANRLMHPGSEIEREYAVRVFGELMPEQLRQLKEGIMLEDGPARFERITPMPGEAEGRNHWYRVVLKEGRNREVRRLFEAVGGTVNRLIRIRYGDLTLPRNLGRGRTRQLTWRQVNALLRQAGLPEERRPDLPAGAESERTHRKKGSTMPSQKRHRDTSRSRRK